MGRQRKDGDPLGLAGTRLAFRHGAFYYRHRDGRWERVGTDVTTAKQRAALYNDPTGVYGTMGYWLDMFLVHCQSRVKAKDMAERTLSDYTKDAAELKVFFGLMLPEHIQPMHVQQYLDLGKQGGRPVRANRERACLSSCLSWLIRTGQTSITVNPCMQQSGVKGNAERKRERYVTHEEYREVHAQAPRAVRLMMELTYRTLQRPESDIIRWTPAVLARDPHSKKRVLEFTQGKTGVRIKIALTADLEQSINQAMGEVPRIDQPLVHNLKGNGYTYTGLMSMLTKAIEKANKIRREAGRPEMAPFGFRDLKGKGATDMWRDGVQIEQIQMLCGHADKTTTEKYIKARWSEAAQPNTVALG
jgi:integrase